MASFLLVGLPRSGTSWVGQALSRGPGVRYLDEPDGFREAFPFRVMMRYGESPILDRSDPAPDYERLWRGILAGGLETRDPRGMLGQLAFERAGTQARRNARAGSGTSFLLRVAERTAQPPRPDLNAQHVFVTSVQCMGSLDWIVERFAPRVIILFRSLLNTIASWHELEYMRNPRETASITTYAWKHWRVEPPPSDAPEIAHRAFIVAVQTGMLRCAADDHPDWTTASHEELCVDAAARLPALAGQIGLDWTKAADDFIQDSNREGGGPWSTTRVTHLQPERWRDRLTPEDVSAINSVIDQFPEEARVTV